MKSIYRFLSNFLFLCCFWVGILCGELYRNDVSNFFHETNLSFNSEKMITDPVVLQRAAQKALLYFDSKIDRNIKISHPAAFEQIVSAKKIKKTLQFIIDVIEKDKQAGKFRILDSSFLNKHFNLIKWSGDSESAYKNNVVIPERYSGGRIPEGQIRLTGYAIFIVDGSYYKTKRFQYPIYAIKDPKFAEKEIFKYTKRNILFGGALNDAEKQGRVTPVAWLTQEGFNDAMMQGSLFIRMPDNEYKLFNIDKSNGFDYDKKLKDTMLQKRYWYFNEIRDRNKNGVLLNLQGAVFAGDVHNIGLGKIIAIRYKNPNTLKIEIRLGVISDSGSALTNNLYQLDLFSGVFRNKDKFKEWISNMPNTVEAYVLVKS